MNDGHRSSHHDRPAERMGALAYLGPGADSLTMILAVRGPWLSLPQWRLAIATGNPAHTA